MSEHDLQSLKLIGGWLCLDFINTVDCRNSEHPHEVLSAYPNLVSWSKRADILTANEAQDLLREAALHPRDASRVLERAITIREALYRIFCSIASNRSPPAIDTSMFNAEMSTAMVQTRLKPASARNPWTYTFEGRKLDQMLWPIIHSAAELLTSDKLDRICECQGDNCGWLFIDMSRNRSRRWCDMKDCGNRAKARRHYQMARGNRS